MRLHVPPPLRIALPGNGLMARCVCCSCLIPPRSKRRASDRSLLLQPLPYYERGNYWRPLSAGMPVCSLFFFTFPCSVRSRRSASPRPVLAATFVSGGSRMATAPLNREDFLAGHFLLRHLCAEELGSPWSGGQGKRMIEFYSPTGPAFGRYSSNERGSLRFVRSHPA